MNIFIWEVDNNKKLRGISFTAMTAYTQFLFSLHFSPQRCSCGAINLFLLQVDKEGTNESETWVLTKGAPEVIHNFLKDAPQDYDEGYKEFAAQGGR